MNTHLTFYGGAQEVGRLSLLLEDHKRNLMLDCGIKLGQTTEYPLLHDDELEKVQKVLISHAHLDHSGYLPHLYSKGVKPKISSCPNIIPNMSFCRQKLVFC